MKSGKVKISIKPVDILEKNTDPQLDRWYTVPDYILEPAVQRLIDEHEERLDEIIREEWTREPEI